MVCLRVKKEPLNERFSCPIVPKLEQFIDSYLPLTSLLPSSVLDKAPQIELKDAKPENVLEKEVKQESDYLMEKVKDEPFEVDNYNQDISKDASISYCIPVTQNDSVSESIVDVKLQPIEDADNNSSRCASSNEKIVMETAVIHQSTAKHVPRNYYCRCSICNLNEKPKDMKYASEEDKLMVMIGCVLRNDYTLHRARLWMCYRKNNMICHSHYTDSIREICKNLNVKNPIELMKCSMKIERNLASVLNVLAPMLNTKDFQFRLNNFYWKNKKIIQLNSTAVYF